MSAVLGLFIRPRIVLIGVVLIFILSVVGLIVAASFSADTLVWIFGITAMATPVLGSIAFVGVLIGSLVRGRFGKRPS
jgi:hypothetical protein